MHGSPISVSMSPRLTDRKHTLLLQCRALFAAAQVQASGVSAAPLDRYNASGHHMNVSRFDENSYLKAAFDILYAGWTLCACSWSLSVHRVLSDSERNSDATDSRCDTFCFFGAFRNKSRTCGERKTSSPSLDKVLTTRGWRADASKSGINFP